MQKKTMVYIVTLFISCMWNSFVCSFATEPVVSKKNKQHNARYRIMIDPGHGGSDFGAYSYNHKIKEKTLCLRLAYILTQQLRKMGYKVHMTRTKDNYVSLRSRAKKANQLHTHLFISLHFNASKRKSAHGIEIFYFQSRKGNFVSTRSKFLAAKVLKEVVYYTRAKSRGIKGRSFAVLKWTQMPAILVEGGFLTNIYECKKLSDRHYLKRLSWGIAKGVDNFFH